MPRSDGSEWSDDRWPVYVLAGGRSRRHGRDKARVQVGTSTLLQGVAGTLGPIASAVIVVADREGRYRDLGCETIADRVPGLGPIGGLATALAHCETEAPGAEWLVLAACDWKGIQTLWIEQLARFRAPGVEAVVFRGDHVEPLLGLYAVASRGAVERAIQSGARAMHELLGLLRCVYVPVPEGWESARNVNRPEDLS